jgi:hypothetical protein
MLESMPVRPPEREPFALKADHLNMIRCLDGCSDHPMWSGGKQEMTFQRIIAGILVLLIAGLAGAFYMNWKTLGQLRTMKAFVEGYVFADAVAACEKAPSTTPFKWNTGTKTSVVGLNSVRPDKYTVTASYTLVADSVYCDYDPIKKKADIGSNFLERE